jgi:dTDP-4-amino-4,6-dideoxygalactose transaminase
MTNAANIALARPWFGEEEEAAVRRVLKSGWVVQGPEVAAFEQAVGAMHQLPHAVAVSSATAGLHLIYLALGIGPGDVVLVPSFAWPSAANMAVRAGAIPFFVDVDPATYNLTSATLKQGLQQVRERGLGRPRAVVVVHEFGLPAPMTELLAAAEAENLLVIEDAACALGAVHQGQPLGHFGRAAVFSFHPRKSVSTGEGGMVVTREPALAEAVRAARNHGQEMRNGRREFTGAGFNYRLTEIQAAIGLEQLKRFPVILAAKRKLAAGYRHELDGIEGLALPANRPEQTWQTFMITLDSVAARDRVQQCCQAKGIETGPGAVAGHTGVLWNGQFLRPHDLCPVSSRLATCGLALPLHAQLTDDDIRRVTSTVCEAMHG